MLKDEPLLAPDRIGTDGAGPYPPAIAAARKEGLLPHEPLHYVTKHLQQGIESDHFRVKRPMPRIGHTAELPPSALLRGLGLQPTDKVLDLERRLRCRLCYAKDQAVVSINWRASA